LVKKRSQVESALQRLLMRMMIFLKCQQRVHKQDLGEFGSFQNCLRDLSLQNNILLVSIQSEINKKLLFIKDAFQAKYQQILKNTSKTS
jgi:hypothetical protein